MSFPLEVSSKEKQHCLQKCFYMMNLIRNKSLDVWEKYQPVYTTLTPEESWEFYHLLMEEYQKLQEAPKYTPRTRKKTKK